MRLPEGFRLLDHSVRRYNDIAAQRPATMLPEIKRQNIGRIRAPQKSLIERRDFLP